jgi:dTDP-4-dehydrorhamnose reductase
MLELPTFSQLAADRLLVFSTDLVFDGSKGNAMNRPSQIR